METLSQELTSISRKIVIEAPRSRVWRALTNFREFGTWFQAQIKEPFVMGKRLELISTHPCGDDARFYMLIEQMEPEHRFSWRWHPGSANSAEDAATLVEFHLEDAGESTIVTVVESGFDGVSLSRRAKAIEQNSNGWETQLAALQKYAQSEAS